MKGKIVLITGASSGIGAACAEKFAEQGARLILTARREERLHQLSSELKNRFNCESLVIALDIQDKSQTIALQDNLPDQ